MHQLVLLPGDPARAMAIATAQMEEPRMFNHRRGLWGYSGRRADGVGFVVQATGMGGPSAAIVSEEMATLGAEVLVRVGTCGALSPALRAGDVLVVESAICDDGASRALGAGDEAVADARLTDALYAHAGECVRERGLHRGKVASVDLFYDPDAGARHERLAAAGAVAVEMEAASVLTVATRRGVRGACILGVSDELHHEQRVRLGHEQIVVLGDLLGLIAARTLAAIAS